MVTNEIVEKCLDELDKNVLQKQPYVNLADFSATLTRADGRQWTDVAGAEMDPSQPEYVTHQIQCKNCVKLELELTYVSCDQEM